MRCDVVCHICAYTCVCASFSILAILTLIHLTHKLYAYTAYHHLQHFNLHLYFRYSDHHEESDFYGELKKPEIIPSKFGKDVHFGMQPPITTPTSTKIKEC